MDQRSHSRDLRLKSLYASSFGVFSFVGTEHRAVIMREEWICQFFPLIKTISYFCFRFIRVALLSWEKTSSPYYGPHFSCFRCLSYCNFRSKRLPKSWCIVTVAGGQSPLSCFLAKRHHPNTMSRFLFSGRPTERWKSVFTSIPAMDAVPGKRRRIGAKQIRSLKCLKLLVLILVFRLIEN